MSGLIGSSTKTLRVQEFRASGTWTRPAGVKTARLFMVGAGGGTNASGQYQVSQPGNVVDINYDVDGKASCAVVIGAGAASSDGGNTTFDGVAVAKGGKASGVYNNNQEATLATGWIQTGRDGFGGMGGFVTSTKMAGAPSNGGAAWGSAPQANTGAGASGTDAIAGGSGYLRVEWYE